MKIHLIGIGGTGMGAVAGLLAGSGHEVRGSDAAVYPPMSEQLAALGVPVMMPYAAANLAWGPDLVVVGNVHGKDHVEVVAAREANIPLTSFPAVLGEQLIGDRHAIVVAGTHGKTTTTSLVAHILTQAGRDPTLFVGGVPVALGQGFHVGAPGGDFVIEGDEYDTAFFDKGPKFAHYRPKTAILTSRRARPRRHLPVVRRGQGDVREARGAHPGRRAARRRRGVAARRSRSRRGRAAAWRSTACSTGTASRPPSRRARWSPTSRGGPRSLEIGGRGASRSTCSTRASASSASRRCSSAGTTSRTASPRSRSVTRAACRCPNLVRGVASFAGVRRRQEMRGIAGGVVVLDDYAHHPTAVRETLKALRKRFPKRRLIAVYEPRSATSRRRTFQHEFVEAFSHADEVVVGKLFDPSKIPADERFDPEKLALDLHRGGTKASYVSEVDAIVKQLAESCAPGDVVCVLSSGSFDGLHDKLLDAIGDPLRPAKRSDMAEIRALLEQTKLPLEPARDDQFGNFYVLRNERGVVGCVALQVLGDDAILRALSVDMEWRGAGYGWMLADMAVGQARWRGVRRIYLLTETASDFFAAKFGFRVVDRTTVGRGIAASETFSQPTAAGLVAMRLDL